MSTTEHRWYAFVRGEDNVVVLRRIEVLCTNKLIKPTKGYQLAGAGLMRVQWNVNEPCPLRITREQAMVDLRSRLDRQLKMAQAEAIRAHDAMIQADHELVEKQGRMTTWWEGVPPNREVLDAAAAKVAERCDDCHEFRCGRGHLPNCPRHMRPT